MGTFQKCKNTHACALRDCLGVSRPFVSDTSPKCIDREGLERRRTGTRQHINYRIHKTYDARMIHPLGSSGSLHVNSPLVSQAQANGTPLIFQLRNTTLVLNCFVYSVKDKLCEKNEMLAFLKICTRILATALSCFTNFRMHMHL